MNDFINIFGSFFRFNYNRDCISELGLTLIVLLAFLTFIVSTHSHIFVFLLLAYYPNLPEDKLLNALYYDRIILGAAITTIVFVSVNIMLLVILNLFNWFRQHVFFSTSKQINYILGVFRLSFIWNCLLAIISTNLLALAIFDSKNLNSPLTSFFMSNNLTSIIAMYFIQWGFIGFIMLIGLNKLFNENFKSKKRFSILIFIVCLLTLLISMENHAMATSDLKFQLPINANKLLKIKQNQPL